MPAPSDFLNSAKRIIEFYKGREEVAPKLRQRLSLIDVDLEKVIQSLKETEELVILDSRALGEEQPGAAMQVWNDFPAGWHNDQKELGSFVRSSPLLDSFFRKGIDITKVYKFSDDQIQFAQKVGNQFPEFSGGLRELRRARSGENRGEKKFNLKCVAENGEFLRFLEGNDVATVKLLRIHRPDGAKFFRIEWFKNNERDTDVFTVFSVNNPTRFTFLEGEWLNAYVYYIILDHLTRNRAIFELYTNVSYKAPADVIRFAGEFDVIGQVRNKLVCVECKSGISLIDRNTISNVIDKISDLRTVVNSVSKEPIDFFFYLVFDPAQNDETEISRALEHSGIRPLRTDQVRAEVVNTFLL